MNRSLASVVVGGVTVALALSTVACGGNAMTVSAEQPWSVLPAEVTGVIHVDMRAMTRAELFRSMDGDIKSLAVAPMDRLAGIVTDTGFDPLTDIDTVTVGGTTAGGPNGPFFAVVKGRFDVERLVAFAESSPHAHALDIEGVQAFETLDPDNPMQDSPTLGWLDETTLLASSADEFPRFIKAVRGQNTLAGTSLARHAEATRHHVFAVFDIPDDAFDGPEAAMILAMAPPLQELETVRIGIDVTDSLDLSVSAMAGTEAGGEAIESTLRGFLGMGAAMSAQNPEAAAMLESLRLDRDGRTVRLSMNITGEQVEQAMEQAMEQVSPQLLTQALSGPGDSLPSPLSPASAGPARRPEQAPGAASGAAAGASDEDGTTASGPGRQRRTDPVISADRYESVVGSWVRVTDTAGVEMKAKLTAVDDRTLTFEKRVSGGTMVMTLDRADVARMTLILRS